MKKVWPFFRFIFINIKINSFFLMFPNTREKSQLKSFKMIRLTKSTDVLLAFRVKLNKSRIKRDFKIGLIMLKEFKGQNLCETRSWGNRILTNNLL